LLHVLQNFELLNFKNLLMLGLTAAFYLSLYADAVSTPDINILMLFAQKKYFYSRTGNDYEVFNS